MLRYVPIVIVLGLTVYSFFDVLATDRARFSSLNKPTWLLVVLLPLIGPLLWLVVGRRHRQTGSAERVIQIRRRDRPIAPDDDPAFLRQLDEQAWRAKRDARRRQSDADPSGGSQSGQQAPKPDDDPDADPDEASGSPPDAESAGPDKPQA